MCAFDQLLKNIKSFIFNERRQGTSAPKGTGRYSQVLSPNGAPESCQLLPPNWPEEECQLLPVEDFKADSELARARSAEGEPRGLSQKASEEPLRSVRPTRNVAKTSNRLQASGLLTPLMKFAIATGNREVVQSLLGRGESPNALDRDGNTALMLAARKGVVEICSILLEAGADSALKDARGRTALDIAEELDHSDVVRVLKPLSETIDEDLGEAGDLDNLFSEENWEEELSPAMPQEQDEKVIDEAQQSISAIATFESEDDGEDWDEELLFADDEDESKYNVKSSFQLDSYISTEDIETYYTIDCTDGNDEDTDDEDNNEDYDEDAVIIEPLFGQSIQVQTENFDLFLYTTYGNKLRINEYNDYDYNEFDNIRKEYDVWGIYLSDNERVFIKQLIGKAIQENYFVPSWIDREYWETNFRNHLEKCMIETMTSYNILVINNIPYWYDNDNPPEEVNEDEEIFKYFISELNWISRKILPSAFNYSVNKSLFYL